MKLSRKDLVQRRHRRIRHKLAGTAQRPRLAVFRSNHHIYVQVIDDVAQHTLASASTLDPDLKESLESSSDCTASAAVGTLIAKRAISAGINEVVFDRGGNLYHGRVKALADAARVGGLNF